MLDLRESERLFGVDQVVEAQLFGGFLKVADEAVSRVEMCEAVLAGGIGRVVLCNGEHLVFPPLVGKELLS